MVMLTNEALAELAKIENKIGDYICRLCCQKFENAFSLALHRCSKIVHVVHRCPECAKVFNCPANLASHRRWHKPRSSSSSSSSLGGKEETLLGKEEGEIYDDGDEDDDDDDDDPEGEEDENFIQIEVEESSTSGRTMVNSPISNSSLSPSCQPLTQQQHQPNRSRPPPQSPPPLKRTKTVCVTGTVKIDSQESVLTHPIQLSTVNSSPIPLIAKCSNNKLPTIKSPIKSPIRSPYKPSPLCSLSQPQQQQPPPPSSKLPPQPSHGPSPTILTKYPLIVNSPHTLFNCESIEPTTESDLPLALTLPTTLASPTSPKSPTSGPISSSSSSSSSPPPPPPSHGPNKSRPIMETIRSSSSTSSSSPSPPPPPPPPPQLPSSKVTQQMNTPTTPPPTPPPLIHQQQQQNQQQQQPSSTATIIGEMTTMTKEPLFGWTYYPKKFRRQAYMRIKHCCP